MGIEIRYQTVNGVVTPYWVPVFDPVGADGLVGADARILELDYMDVDGVQTPYWVPDTNGDKYTDDFPGGPQEPTGFVAKYTSYLVDNFTLVTGDSVNVWADETTKTYGSEEVTNGDFSDGSTDWIFAGGSSIINNQANILSVTGEYAIIRQNDVYEIGKTYEITYDVIATDGQDLRSNSNIITFPTSTTGSKSVITTADEVNFFMKRPTSGVPCNVTVDNISVKEVLTGANDLTQATSANQPKLVEDYTATQFTASNQPTLVDDAGTWKLDFDTDDYMDGLKPQSGDFTYVFKGLDYDNTGLTRFLSESNFLAERFYFQQNVGGQWICKDDAGGFHVITTPILKYSQLVLKKEGAVLSLYGDSTLIGNFSGDVTSETFTMLRLGNNSGSINGTLQSLEIYDVAVADVTNITETPVQTLTADPLKMRTSANLNPTDGQDVAKWYADEFSAYRDARVVFDNNDYMEGLPALTGDWSYMIDTSINTLGTAKYLLEQTAGSSAILALADNYMYLRDTTGVNDIALTSYTLTTGRTQFGFVRSGDDLLYYVNGVLKETVDVTGRTFDFGTVGKSSASADMDTKQIIPFDRALTQTEIDYYSYLRSETGDILLPPLLPSVPTVYDVNSATLNGTDQYYDAGNPSELQITGVITASIWGYVPDSIANGGTLFSKTATLSPTQGEGWRLDYQKATGLGAVLVSSTGNYADPYAEPVTPSAIPVDEWFHLAFTYDGSEVILYLNGVAGTPIAYSSGIKDHGTVRIGNVNINSSILFGGSLNSPMVFNRSLSSTEITALYNNGTVPCYADIDTSITDDCVYAPPLYNGADISIGQEITDQSSSGITTTAIGSPTYTDQGLTLECTPPTTQIYNVNSATLDSSRTQYFTYPAQQDISASGSGSFRYVVRPTNVSNRNFVHTMRIDSSNYFQVKTAPTGLVIVNWSGGANQLNETLAYSFVNGTWYDVVLSQSSGTLSLYVNGSLVGNFSSGIDTTFNSTFVQYGAYTPSVDYFQGQMSFVSFHENYALSQSDVTSLYNDGDPICYDSWDSGLKTNTEFMANLGTWTGSNEPTTDQTGNGNNLTAVGSPTYTDQGLQVECDT